MLSDLRCNPIGRPCQSYVTSVNPRLIWFICRNHFQITSEFCYSVSNEIRVSLVFCYFLCLSLFMFWKSQSINIYLRLPQEPTHKHMFMSTGKTYTDCPLMSFWKAWTHFSPSFVLSVEKIVKSIVIGIPTFMENYLREHLRTSHSHISAIYALGDRY